MPDKRPWIHALVVVLAAVAVQLIPTRYGPEAAPRPMVDIKVICDWNLPPVGEQPSQPWVTFADSPGLGRPLGPPPACIRAR